jgi:serine/threonine-protein kinase
MSGISRLILSAIAAAAFVPSLSTAQPAPPDATRQAAERITGFINGYNDGDCFFVTVAQATETTAVLEAYGSSLRPGTKLDAEFARQIGFEAHIDFHFVAPAQCPALNFLSRMQNRQQGMGPRLDISTSERRVGGVLTGTIADFGNRTLSLFMVANDGNIYNLTSRLETADDTKSFSVAMLQVNPATPQPHLLLAVVGSNLLETSRSELRLPANSRSFSLKRRRTGSRSTSPASTSSSRISPNQGSGDGRTTPICARADSAVPPM